MQDTEMPSSVETKLRGLEPTEPAALRAVAIGWLAHDHGFDWKSPDQVFSKLSGALEHLRSELFGEDPSGQSSETVRDLMGDLYFCLAQFSRHIGENPEELGERGNKRFIRRLQSMLDTLDQKGQTFADLSKEEKEKLWVSTRL